MGPEKEFSDRSRKPQHSGKGEMMLKREDFTPQRIDELIAEARKYGPYDALTHEERENSRQDFLKNRQSEDGLWVFGYGSLLWNPAFEFDHSMPARLYGYRRSFCLKLSMGRGSAEKPGLMLALDNGGSCNGRGFYIPAQKVESETRILWMREMLSGAYRATECKLTLQNGEKVPALTFVVNHQHRRYTPEIDIDEKIKLIATGEGYLGTCRDYLSNTVTHLEEINVKDQYLHYLMKKVENAYPKKK
jgi:cation transport protein ChaC